MHHPNTPHSPAVAGLHLAADALNQGMDTEELEDLLDSAKSEAQDDLPELEDLLGEATAHQRDVKAAAEARERLRRGGLTVAERQADAARIREWEAKHEWAAQANVARFVESRCENCTGEDDEDGYTYLFTGLFERQTHRHIKDATRWVKVTTAKAALPNEVMVAREVTQMCGECCEGIGFGWAGAYYEDEAAGK